MKKKSLDITNIRGSCGLKMCMWYLVPVSLKIILLENKWLQLMKLFLVDRVQEIQGRFIRCQETCNSVFSNTHIYSSRKYLSLGEIGKQSMNDGKV